MSALVRERVETGPRALLSAIRINLAPMSACLEVLPQRYEEEVEQRRGNTGCDQRALHRGAAEDQAENPEHKPQDPDWR